MYNAFIFYIIVSLHEWLMSNSKELLFGKLNVWNEACMFVYIDLYTHGKVCTHELNCSLDQSTLDRSIFGYLYAPGLMMEQIFVYEAAPAP